MKPFNYQCLTYSYGNNTAVMIIIFSQLLTSINANGAEPYRNNLILYPQMGHSSGISSLAISSAGNLLATGAKDRTIRLWDIKTGTELRTFKTHETVSSLIFSGDDSALYYLENHSFIYRNIYTGESRVLLPNTAHINTALAISKDGKLIALGTILGHVKLWSVTTGKLLYQQDFFSDTVTSIEFAENSESLVAASDDGKVIQWHLVKKKIMTEYRHKTNVTAANFCAEHCIISGSWDGELKLWDSKRQRILYSEQFDTHITDIDVDKSQAIAAIATKKTINKNSTFIRPKPVFFYDLKAQKIAGRALNTGRTTDIDVVKIHSNGFNIVIGSRDGTVRMFDLQNSSQRINFQEKSSHEKSIAVSADGKKAVTISGKARLTVWDLVNGKIESSITLSPHDIKKSGAITAIDLSSDGYSALLGTLKGDLRVYDLDDYNRSICTETVDQSGINFFESAVMRAHILPNNYIAGLALGNASRPMSSRFFIMNEDCEIVEQIPLPSNTYKAVIYSLSLESKLAISVNQQLQLFDLGDGRIVKTPLLIAHKNVTPIAFSQDGNKLAMTSENHKITVIDTTTGLQNFPFIQLDGFQHIVSFSPNGKNMAIGGQLHGGYLDLVILDTDSGKEINKVPFNDVVWGLAYTKSKSHLLISSARGITILDPQTLQTKLLLSGTRDGEWVAVTPNGYYTSSIEGTESVYWVNNNTLQAYTFHQFSGSANKPEVIKAVLSGKNPLSFPPPQLNSPPTLKVLNIDSAFTQEKNYQLKLQGGSDSHIQDLYITVLRNGTAMVNQEKIDKPSNKDFQLSYAIPLVSGENVITAVLHTLSGQYSNKVTIKKRFSSSTEKPKLYTLYIGVGEYPKYKGKNLPAVKNDVNVFKKFTQLIAKDYHSSTYKQLLNHDVTMQKVLNQLEILENTSPDDLVIIYLAGHGGKDEQGFFFMTDEASHSTPRKGAIEFSDIAIQLNNIKARTLLLLDACHSSQQIPISNQNIASSFSSGVMIYAASKGKQFAQEGINKQSFFMSALLDSVSSKRADRNHNGYLELSELVDYSTYRVKNLSKGAQHPWFTRRAFYGDFPITKLHAE